MKANSILISVILVLAFGSVVLADSIDVSTSFHEHHILEVELTPDPSSDVVFILNYGAKTKSTILDGEEELVSLGDFQVVEFSVAGSRSQNYHSNPLGRRCKTSKPDHKIRNGMQRIEFS